MKKKLKVLLYTHFFYPDVGGIESISLALAEGLTEVGYECVVVTKSVLRGDDTSQFKVYRRPSLTEKIRLVRWADVIVYNGAGLGLQPFPVLFNKPFVWIHQGYQISCIDGLGWVDGEKAPMTPWASILYHAKKNGVIYALSGGVKVFTKLFFAKYLVTKNIACSDWVLNRLPKLPQKRRIYSPFPLKRFLSPSKGVELKYEFVFVGRLVSEKGILTLISAFETLVKNYDSDLNLLIVGDGNWKSKVEQAVAQKGIINNVKLVGRKAGQELTDLIYSCKIAIVPSEWEEPLGGVALELLTANRNIIVSRKGGLAECVGNAGLTFENGNSDDLAKAMKLLLSDLNLQKEQKLLAKEQLKPFETELRVQEFIDLFEDMVK